MQLPPDVSFELLDRYFTGRCTAEEAARVRHALATTPALAALQRVLVGAPVDVEAAWREFVQSSWMQEHGDDVRPLFPAHMERRKTVGAWRRSTRHGPWYALAAAAAALIAVVGWHPGRSIRHVPQGHTPMVTYSTGNGERATITLPDSSTVTLDVASRLEIPTDYAAGDRVVSLRGAALFAVPHHSRTPLTVLAGPAKVRVLGTRFVVRRYATDTSTTVAVADGKVGVGATVVPAQRAVEVGRTGVSPLRPADASLFSFATGTLMLPDMPLSRAIVELDRWYDTEIRLGTPALATQRIMGKFGAGSLADLTAILQMTFDVHVVRNGRVLTLYAKK